MDKPTKILVIGLVGSALFLIAGFMNYKHDQQHLYTLISQCESEKPNPYEQFVTSTPKSDKKGPWDKYNDVKPRFPGTPICAPNELRKIRYNSVLQGVQEKIVQADQSVGDNRDYFCMVALILAGISAIPYVWYFLLRRLRELRDALR